MQTIEELRELCRDVGKGVEKMVAVGEEPGAKSAATLPPHFAKSGGR